jgi:hypothetical protein
MLSGQSCVEPMVIAASDPRVSMHMAATFVLPVGGADRCG